MERIGWEKKRSLTIPYSGLGLGCAVHEVDDRHSDGFAGSYASVEIGEDGTALVVSGEGEYGQGSQTVMAQCAAEVLGLAVEKVDVTFPDTDRTPYSLGPWGSRITISAGNAVKLAAEDAREKLLGLAADMLKAKKDDLMIEDERIFVKGSASHDVTIAEVAKHAIYHKYGGKIIGWGTDEPNTTKMDPTKQSNPCSDYSYGAAAAEVEVDPHTGRVNVLSIATCIDAGNILNPFNAIGQCWGQLMQGIGYALQEEIKYNGGDIFNPGILGMGTPSCLDVPPTDIQFATTYAPDGPFGAKGVAEVALVPVIGALANAISNALGTEITQLPLTPENILRIIREKEGGA
jgi:CO/xanthine dehydrogenase Mo-binding subunit